MGLTSGSAGLPHLLAFLLGTGFFAWVSRHALRRPRSHGFYRFFAWEAILALVLLNLPVWEREPFSPPQLASWGLLAASLALAIHAVQRLRRQGRPSAARGDAELYAFEKTSALVTSGIYRYIRHPMYAALGLLAWGAYLKDPGSAAGIALVGLASLALWLTALRDEAECLAHFGADYRAYMRTSKRFIPFVL